MLIHFARLTLLASLLSLPLVSACSSDDGADDESFATFQDCFDDHHGEEGFTVEKAITICCLDHGIGGQEPGVVCGPTGDTCDAYVDENLDVDDATADEVTNGCTDYVTQMGT